MKSIILFYHPQCKACNALMDKIEDKKTITFVNIYEEDVQYNIKVVPCIIIDKSRLLEGKECFDLFDNKPEMKCISTKKTVGFSDITNGSNSTNMFDIHTKIGAKKGTNDVKYTEENNGKIPTLEEIMRQREQDML
jgi:hypothetical protein